MCHAAEMRVCKAAELSASRATESHVGEAVVPQACGVTIEACASEAAGPCMSKEAAELSGGRLRVGEGAKPCASAEEGQDASQAAELWASELRPLSEAAEPSVSEATGPSVAEVGVVHASGWECLP